MVTSRIRIVVAIGVGVLLLAGVGVFWWLSPSHGPWKSGGVEIGESTHDGGDQEGGGESLASRRDGDVGEGGERPDAQASDVRGPMHYGVAKSVRADANAYVRSVAEGAKKGNRRPERLSPFIAPKPFDPAAYKADPQKYITTVEPGRVFQSAQPGRGVPVLRSSGGRYRHMLQGETRVLKVRAPAGSPVTFTSFDLGAFDNLLPSQTVRTSVDGIAQVNFRATSGTVGGVNILAGCPLATGQVKFRVEIEMPPDSRRAGR